MQNDKRLTADRWFGKIDDRLDHLRRTFEHVDANNPTEESLVEWVLETTNAQTEDAVNRRLRFLKSIQLLEQSDSSYRLTEHSQEFLETGDSTIIFERLRINITGFDNLIKAATRGPLTNERCHEILAENSDFDGNVGVAVRHREWLQMLGIIEESNEGNEYTLTEQGEDIYQETKSSEQGSEDAKVSFELNKQYARSDLHDEYGGNRQSGIAPVADYPVIFLFAGSSGEYHGYEDEFLSDGTFKYTGEGQEGDMEFIRGNRAIRNHQANDDELHLFWQEGEGMVRYLGQFEYVSHEWVRLPDTHGDERDAIRFSLAPVGDIMIPDGGDFKRLDPSESSRSDDSTNQSPSVFMARGYKDDPFHRHVARSLANYFSESKRSELKQMIDQYQEQQELSFDTDEIFELLDSDTVTAWGTKDKTEDVELFEQMKVGDRFIMRTGQPSEVRYIQEVDLLLGEEVPLDLRKELSDRIWTSSDYEYIWFSESKIADLHCPQEEFEEIVSEAIEGFEIEDWFPSQGKNFTRIDDDVLMELGGQKSFLKRLINEFDGQLREPNTENHFLLNAGDEGTEFTDDQFFVMKQTEVDNWQQVEDAENDGNVVIHENGTILGYGRLGNFEGERRDDGNYKLANIIDWHEATGQIDHVGSELDISFMSAADGSGIIRPAQDPITSIEADDYAIIRSSLDVQTAEKSEGSDDTPATSDYWDNLKLGRERMADFVQNPSEETLRSLIDNELLSTQLPLNVKQTIAGMLQRHSPEEIAEAIQTAAENQSPETLDQIHGVGVTKASELLRLYQPDTHAMFTERSKVGMKALGYPVSETESDESYQEFVEYVQEAIELFDLPELAAEVSDKPIPDWATKFDTADYLFAKHFGDHQFELPPSDACSNEVPSAPYYWVNQTNSPDEIEQGYLEATPDNAPGHDLSRLEEGDTVFHFAGGEIIGYSEVTESATLTATGDGPACRVEVSLTKFNPPIAFADVFRRLARSDVALEHYYPVNEAGINQGYLFNLSEDAGEYLLEEGGVKEPLDNPVINQYREQEDCAVWQFTASPSTLLTVLRRGSLPLPDGTDGTTDQRDEWINTKQGDVVILQADSEERNFESIDIDSNGGIVGVAVVKDHDQKSDRWWYDEHEALRYPYLITLDELHATGDLSQINFEEPLFAMEHSDLVDEIDALMQNSISWSNVPGVEQIQLNTTLSPGADDYTSLTDSQHDVSNLMQPLFQELVPNLQEVTRTDDLPAMLPAPKSLPSEDRRELETELERTGQVVLFGPPGTGKTFTATRFAHWWIHEQTDRPKTTRFRTVTFHPSFSYEDFMEGLTAEATDEGQVEYNYKDGTFKEIVQEARSAYLKANNPDDVPRYVLLIDEINRGNLSQIFGEAITQLEMDKRLGQDDAVTVQWAHSGDSIALPPNLYIIGTMNTADRSIALIDAALRRRFGFLSFPPDYGVFPRVYDFDSAQEIEDLAEDVISGDREQAVPPNKPSYYPLLALSIRALRAINENIIDKSDLTKGKRIGHSYLLGIESEKELVAAWQHDILPLLEEYYFGDFNRLRKEVFEVDMTAETEVDSRLFDQDNHEIARVDADDLEQALSTFVDNHEFS